jgi:O-antigen/teichoic acid export membrane protein
MSLSDRVGRNSLVYTVTTFLQKGVALLLLPLYTRYLAPQDYGILAVVGALVGLVQVLFTLSLPASITRFFFTYRDQPERLKEFWGTALTLVLLVSATSAGLLLLLGSVLLAPFHGQIAFWPYVALGILTAAFQPLSTIFLAILQTREEVGRYALHTSVQFLATAALVIALVVFAGWRAEGPLVAGLIVAMAYFGTTLYALRGEYRLCFKPEHVKSALRYSLPLVPHSLAAQTTGAADRILLNHLMGAASAGLYGVGTTVGAVIALVANSVNRAYMPVVMDALQSGDRARLTQLRQAGLVLVVGYSLLAAALSTFAREAVEFLTAPAFHGSHVVVPFIAFGFVATGIYYLLVGVLFFNPGSTKIIAVATGISAAANVVLNWLLIGAFGLIGAGIAALLTQVMAAVLVARLARAHEPVPWHYGKLAVAPLLCLGFALGVNQLEATEYLVLVKLLCLAALFWALNLAFWGDMWFMARHAVRVVGAQRRWSGTARSR